MKYFNIKPETQRCEWALNGEEGNVATRDDIHGQGSLAINKDVEAKSSHKEHYPFFI